METINLTPAELELIRIKREEEALVNERRRLEEVAEEERILANAKADEEKNVKIAQKELDSLLQLQIELCELSKDKNAFSLVQYQKQLQYGSYNYKVTKSNLIHAESQSTIEAHEYYVSVGTGFYSKSRYEGIRFKLQIPSVYDRKNDNLKSAKTIHEKIVSAFISKKNKEEVAKSRLEGIEWLMEYLTQTYPNGTVTRQTSDGYYTGRNRTIWNAGTEYGQVEFANKLILKFSWKKDDQMTAVRTNVNINQMSKEDQEAIVTLFAK